MKITDATEEEVFKESNGGNGHMNAYWVVYVNNDIANEIAQSSLHTYKTGEGQASEANSNHPYGQRLSGQLNLLIEDDNIKFREEIIDWQATQAVKQIQKRFDEKYADYSSGMESLDKMPNQGLANLAAHLHLQKEDNILKKLLLDQCFREVKEISLLMLEEAKDEPIIKKLNLMIIGKSSKYPKESVFLNQGEKIKLKRFTEEYVEQKKDAFITNEILISLISQNLTDAIAIIEFTFNRVGFAVNTNSFRKIPRDALRVCILSMTTKINEMLVNNNEDTE